MTDEERFALIISVIGATRFTARDRRIPEGVAMSAGYTPGVPRLGVPALQSSDASMGITNPGYRPDDPGATALPASIVVGASFNPRLAREGGVVLGREARIRGFNAVLAGGINLARDPRNGRNFEYYSEDPYHSAVLGAEAVNGIQGQGVISTLKHFTLNCNETNRHWLDAIIDPAAHRESDLLAFQIAIERSRPGSIMSSYNKVNGDYASGSHHLLNEVLKSTWGYPGWVMSDWGATPSWEFALSGLDQESGANIDAMFWKSEPFTEPLRKAYEEGKFPRERLSEMVRRILRSMFAVGVDSWGSAPEVDMAAHNQIALETARQGIVLLKNDGALPLPSDRPLTIAVIGGHAQEGVPSGTGSGAVLPVGGYAAVIKIGGVEAFALDADPEGDHHVRALRHQRSLGRRGPWVELDPRVGKALLQLRKRRGRQQIEIARSSHGARATDLDHGRIAADGEHRARAGAARYSFLGVAADHRDLQRLVHRQRQRAVVLQQHDALARGVQRDVVVPGHVDRRSRSPLVDAHRVR